MKTFLILEKVLVKMSDEIIYLPQIHIVDISPHRFQRDVGCRIIRNNGCDFVDILHAVPALMKTETPVWHHDRLTNDFAILPSDVKRARASNNVQVNDTSDHIILEILPTGAGVVDLEIHAIAIQHENSMGLAGTLAIFEIDRMVTVKIRI